MNIAEELALKRQLTIDYWARYTIADLQKSIRKKNIGRTHSLISSLKFHYKSTGGEDTIELEFNGYGKFLDMGVGRGRKLGDLAYNREVYKAIGQKNKQHKWLSKTAYKQIAALKGIMLSKYGEDLSSLIKESLEDKT